MSKSGSQQDIYSRDYGRSGAQLSYRGSGKPDIYSREYRHSGAQLSYRGSDKPDIYSREYGQSGAQLSYRGSGKPDIYSREYVRGGTFQKQASVHVPYTHKAAIPAMKSTKEESVVEKNEAISHTEPQPSIFDKISQFLHGVLGQK